MENKLKLKYVNGKFIIDSELEEDFKKDLNELIEKYNLKGNNVYSTLIGERNKIEKDEDYFAIVPYSYLETNIYNYISEFVFIIDENFKEKDVYYMKGLKLVAVNHKTNEIYNNLDRCGSEQIKKFANLCIKNKLVLPLSALVYSSSKNNFCKDFRLKYLELVIEKFNSIKTKKEEDSDGFSIIKRSFRYVLNSILANEDEEEIKATSKILNKFNNKFNNNNFQRNMCEAYNSFFYNTHRPNKIASQESIINKFLNEVKTKLNLNVESYDKILEEPLSYKTNLFEFILYIKNLNKDIKIADIKNIIELYYDIVNVYEDITENFNSFTFNRYNVRVTGDKYFQLNKEEVEFILYMMLKHSYDTSKQIRVDTKCFTNTNLYVCEIYGQRWYPTTRNEFHISAKDIITKHVNDFPKIAKKVTDAVI